MNANKATGWDGIPPRILKLAAREIAPPLTHLFNLSITEGNYPSCWKRGEWVPAFKKNDRNDKSNYRPITVLNTVNKIFEQQLSRQITQSIDSDLSQCMSPYRTGYSCETALLKLIEDWKTALDSKGIVGILSTDTFTAFDSLHPPLMLSKLKAYNFSERALNLIRSYFELRQGRVRLSRATST